MITLTLVVSVASAQDAFLQAAFWGVQCNVPIDVETVDPAWQTADLHGSRPACSPEAIAAAFGTVFPDCRFHARVDPEDPGRVIVGPGRVIAEACNSAVSILDTPLGLGSGSDVSAFIEAIHALGIYEGMIPLEGIQSYDQSPSHTLRDVLRRVALRSTPEGRKQSLLLRPMGEDVCRHFGLPDECRALGAYEVGGPYSIHRDFTGPFDYRTQWWVENGPRYRPMTDAEESELRTVRDRHDRGEITDLEYAEAKSLLSAVRELNPRADGLPWHPVFYSGFDGVTGEKLVDGPLPPLVRPDRP